MSQQAFSSWSWGNVLGIGLLAVAGVWFFLRARQMPAIAAGSGLIGMAVAIAYWLTLGPPETHTPGQQAAGLVIGCTLVVVLQWLKIRWLMRPRGRLDVLPPRSEARVDALHELLHGKERLHGENITVRQYLQKRWQAFRAHGLPAAKQPWCLALLDEDHDLIRREMPLEARRSAQLKSSLAGLMLTFMEGHGFPTTHSCQLARRQRPRLPHDVAARVHGTVAYQPIAEMLRQRGFPITWPAIGDDHDVFLIERQGTMWRGADGKLHDHAAHRFSHRTLIDPHGRVVPFGIWEGGLQGLAASIRIQPALYKKRIRRAHDNRWGVLFSYRITQVHRPSGLSILDTPPTLDSWPELIIAADGSARLFVGRDASDATWQECVHRLREHWLGALAEVELRLCRLLAQPQLLDRYMAGKLEILSDYFEIHDIDMEEILR